jgi:Putative Actinobacterial Holin-X, holin superfamily III
MSLVMGNSLERLRDRRPTPTVTESLDRVVDAAQNVVGDQIDLLRAEAESAVVGALRSTATMLAGVVLLLIAWAIILAAAYDLLVPRTGSLGGLAILAAANLVPGVALLVTARRRGRPEVARG